MKIKYIVAALCLSSSMLASAASPEEGRKAMLEKINHIVNEKTQFEKKRATEDINIMGKCYATLKIVSEEADNAGNHHYYVQSLKLMDAIYQSMLIPATMEGLNYESAIVRIFDQITKSETEIKNKIQKDGIVAFRKNADFKVCITNSSMIKQYVDETRSVLGESSPF